MSNFKKHNDYLKNNNICNNQSNSNTQLNIRKSLNLDKNLLIDNNNNISTKLKSLTVFNYDQIENKEKKNEKNCFNIDNRYVPISNLLIDIDKNANDILDKNDNKNNSTNKNNNCFDIYKLGPGKVSIFNNNMSFSEYICSMLGCLKKSKNAIYVLERFRKKLLSEEHFFRANVFLCLAEKFLPLNNIEKKIDIVELYENL